MSKIEELKQVYDAAEDAAQCVSIPGESFIDMMHRAQLAGIAAVVRALRDEMFCNRPLQSASVGHHCQEVFNEILGDAGDEKVGEMEGAENPLRFIDADKLREKIATDPDLPCEAGTDQSPATAPAPAVCEWTDYSVSSWKGSHRHEDSYWIRGCDASHVQKYAFGKPCPSCGKPIKFTEAK